MGITERREREKIERRIAILNCAKKLILEKGVERVSMEDIARKAELSKATVYLYFSGKEALLNEICEESARFFMEHFGPILKSGLRGMEALKRFWHTYIDLFRNSDEILLVFEIRNYLNPGQPFFLTEGLGGAGYTDTILETLETTIDQCKTEGIFDSNLDSAKMTRMVLLMFSNSVYNAARMPAGAKKTPVIIEEMTKAFQIILHGFAREGIDRSLLCIGTA